MKHIVCAICLFALLLSSCSAVDRTPIILEGKYPHGIYELRFTTKRISNHSVGNDWLFAYTYNGKSLKNRQIITCSLEIFLFLKIKVEVRENDKIDDVGTGTLTVGLCDGASSKTRVTVTETNGRYKGNTAVWEISCEVKMVGKQSLD